MTTAGDQRQLPLADKTADLIVSGWSVCYLGNSNNADWQENSRKVMHEIRRILRPGGRPLKN
ncbi:methyltransferase domain-containing protein [Paenibacillus sp. FSL H8-0548]|uniref:class I SAM-dependent methyltransferase n=1 Tax=Paenibacillus sp. FSL H8-0548 TaxID=1920422 RepID=UPI0009F8CB92